MEEVWTVPDQHRHIYRLSSILRILESPSTKRIISALWKGARTSKELSVETGVRRQNVDRILRALVQAGVVRTAEEEVQLESSEKQEKFTGKVFTRTLHMRRYSLGITSMIVGIDFNKAEYVTVLSEV